MMNTRTNSNTSESIGTLSNWNNSTFLEIKLVSPSIFQNLSIEKLNLDYNDTLSDQQKQVLFDIICSLPNLTTLKLIKNESQKNSRIHRKSYNLTSLNVVCTDGYENDQGMKILRIPDWKSHESHEIYRYRYHSFPEWIAHLTNLTALDMSSNELTQLPKHW